MRPLNCYSFGAGGAITAVDATNQTTIAYTPTIGRTAFLWHAVLRGAGEPNNPTMTCTNGLTWTRRASVYAGAVKISLFTAPVGSSSSGTANVDYGGQTQDVLSYAFGEVDADVADLIVQIVTNTVAAGTGYTLTLPGAFKSAGNGVMVGFACDINSGSLRSEQGYNVPNTSSAAALAVPFRDAGGLSLGYAWRPDNDAACVITQGSANGVGIMFEMLNPNAIQDGAYVLSGNVKRAGVNQLGATVRVIDRTTGDSKTTTTDASGNWSLSVNHATADRYAAMWEYETGGQKYAGVAPWAITSGAP